MATEELTSEDQAFLDHIEGGDESDVQPEPGGELHPALEKRLAKMERRFEKQLVERDQQIGALEDRLDEQAATIESQRETITDLAARVNDHGARLQGEDPTNPRNASYYDDLTLLEKHAQKSEAERKADLEGEVSKQRAVAIFENWQDWSQAGAIDPSEQLISTLHTRGQYNKLAVKVDLQNATDDDLQNIEVYRAMKQVAKLSVTDPDDVETVTDQNGREHITGGAFEYHEKMNSDNSKKFKVLKLVDPDTVTLP